MKDLSSAGVEVGFNEKPRMTLISLLLFEYKLLYCD